MYENLHLNDIGDNVKILQEKLKVLGYYNGIITGSFGMETEVGVKKFQYDNGLPVTGNVNSSVWDLLDSYTNYNFNTISLYPTLKYGSTGDEVKDLQVKLTSLLYYNGNLSGNFDLETENAVKRLQLNNKLTSDGIVGNKTWDVINTLYGNLADCILNNDDNNYDDEYFNYTVISGDTLYSLARKYNTTVSEIKKLNNLTSDILRIGQVLKIPNNNNYILYTVVRGDSLYAIARKYNTTVMAIMNLNNLSSDFLSIGQVLKIPTNNDNNYSDNYFNYTVISGDTLYSLARKYNTTVSEIKKLNNLTSDILRIGQVLKIPM